jgi:hypothetical protein
MNLDLGGNFSHVQLITIDDKLSYYETSLANSILILLLQT